MSESRLRAILYMLPQLGRALLSKPATIGYPFAPLDLSPYYRGRIVVDADRCRGCGLCVRDCPAEGLVLVRESKDEFRLLYYADRCAYCGQCETSCPSGAIRQVNEFVPGSDERADMAEVLAERS
jgi:formate hydrogenlyase subunit 6/NADH:ubiquinone oxidoreductase subunit I